MAAGLNAGMRALLAGLLSCLAPMAASAGPEATELEARMAACPGMATWQARMEAESRQRAARRQPPTNPALRAELLELMQVDQDVRMVFIRAQREPTAAELQRMAETDGKHQQRMQALIQEAGFPSAAAVGPDGSNAAFLLVQHAPDAAFQAWALAAMEPLLAEGNVSRADYALLFDRVRIAQGGPQRYGSQFKVQDGVTVLEPVERPAELDARREQMWLPPMTAYACMMRVMDGRPVDLSGLRAP